jgi:hypothetical protein
LVVVVNVPAEHVVQVRSAVVEPAFAMHLPATQVVFATQLVAGSPSLSHSLAEQLWAEAVPPAQYWPATQFVQTALLVDVAAAVWTVPASQSVAVRHGD